MFRVRKPENDTAGSAVKPENDTAGHCEETGWIWKEDGKRLFCLLE